MEADSDLVPGEVRSPESEAGIGERSESGSPSFSVTESGTGT